MIPPKRQIVQCLQGLVGCSVGPNIEKSIKEQGFTVRRATKADYMRILSVYFEQNVTSDFLQDYDGDMWIDR